MGVFNWGVFCPLSLHPAFEHYLYPSIQGHSFVIFPQIPPKRLDLTATICCQLVNMVEIFLADILAIQCPVKLRLDFATGPQRISQKLDELLRRHIIKTLLPS
jgi:hypothetical protein